LLQAADPLPEFSAPLQGVTVDAFFTHYLVKRGPRGTRLLREECASVLAEKCRWEPNPLSRAMKAAILERTKEITALSAFTNISEITGRLDGLSQRAILQTEKVLVSVVVHLTRPLKKRSFADYAKKPALLAADFGGLTADIPESLPQRQAIYGFLTTGFDLQRFRAIRSQLAPLDELLAAQIARDQAQLVADLFPEARTRDRPTRHDMLLAALDRLPDQHPEALERLRSAFRESFPLRKLEEIATGIGKIKKYVQSTFPPSVVLGEDEFMPVTLAYFYMANPPDIITNFVFVHDFCSPPVYCNLFEGWIEQATAAMSVVVGKLKEFQPSKFFRMKAEY
jgi:hypothetical protein